MLISPTWLFTKYRPLPRLPGHPSLRGGRFPQGSRLPVQYGHHLETISHDSARHSDMTTLHFTVQWAKMAHLPDIDFPLSGRRLFTSSVANWIDHWNKGRRSLVLDRLSGQPRLPVELVSPGPGESGVTNCGFYLSSFSSDGADPGPSSSDKTNNYKSRLARLCSDQNRQSRYL